jgi:hypothetical protein
MSIARIHLQFRGPPNFDEGHTKLAKKLKSSSQFKVLYTKLVTSTL